MANPRTQHAERASAQKPAVGPSERQPCYLACCYHAGRLGVAYFEQGEVYVLQTYDEALGPFAHQALQLVKAHASPSVIYTSSKMDEAFVQSLKQGGLDVRLEKHNLFHPDQAQRWLQQLRVSSLPDGVKGLGCLHKLNTLVNLSCSQQVAALGALLAILHREDLLCDSGSVGAQADNEVAGAEGITIERISEVSLNGFLVVDPLSSEALQVFHEDKHPSAMGIGQAKEGFSVFGILNRCVTSMGRRLLKVWFHRPIINLDVLRDRQDAIDFFIHNFDVVKTICATLSKIKDAPRILHRLRMTQGVLDPRDFIQILDSISALLLLRDTLAAVMYDAGVRSGMTAGLSGYSSGGIAAPDLPQHSHSSLPKPPVVPNIIPKALSCIGEEMLACATLISDIIDAEQASEGMMVAYGVCEQLDDLKHTYAGLPDFLTLVLEEELKRVPRHLGHLLSQQLWSIVYFPQVGFMMRMEGRHLEAALAEYLPDFQFALEATDEDAYGVYYNTDRTKELNDKFGDLLHTIHDLEGSIATELIRRLAEFSSKLDLAVAVATEVDCLMSLATTARENEYCRPTLTKENVLYIKQGRHLLTEQLVDTFIPNDTVMATDSGRIQVVTGPNFSGKSCYAKQVALIVFLAHIGSFVPAQSATVGLVDRIFTRLSSQECGSLPQSTFMIDLSQIASMLQLATSRSLCIIDEFGKGTLTTDGIGLLSALLKRFAVMPDPPKAVVCTHFTEVLSEAYLPRHPQLAFLTMNVLSESTSTGENQQPDSVVFLYRLVSGFAAPSFGVHCARLAGVSGSILERAMQVIDLHQRGQAVAPIDSPERLARDEACRAVAHQVLQLNTRNRAAVQAFVEQFIDDCDATRSDACGGMTT